MSKLISRHLVGSYLVVIFIFTTTISKATGNPGKDKALHTYLSQYENVLGTSMELKISASSPSRAAEAERNVLQEISRLSKILSTYDDASEFSRWQKTMNLPVPVSRELFDVMQLFDTWKMRTKGAIDASAEIITRLWKKAALSQHLPDQKDINEAISQVKQTHWVLDADLRTATHLDHAPLMFNSFVKSYIIKHSVEAALKPGGVAAIILNIGGDLVISGDVSEHVSISDPKADAENEKPLDVLLIQNKAVATSGNYRRGENIEGRWYSHIVDPRTGLPADNILSATVVSDDATEAGVLATAFNVMPVSESVQLASGIPGIQYLIITREGERITSKGWKQLETAAGKKEKEGNAESGKNVGKAKWNNGFEMIINLEINTQKEGFSKRPYLAIWVEDSTHAAIRNIAMWHGSDRYVPELKSWYLKYRSVYNSDMNFKNSVTSATRPAGKYTVQWDGKDDKGNYVAPGKYIIKIEISREHGTYQLMRQEIDCNEMAKQINLPGNIEISSVSFDYRKK